MPNETALFKKKVTTVFHALKYAMPTGASPVVPVYQQDRVVAVLRVVTVDMIRRPDVIKLLGSWRKKSNRWFPSQFRVTYAGTKRWGKTQLLDKEDRILFMIEDLTGRPIGHLGFYRFDFKTYSCEVDNVIRGINHVPGVMTAAITSLCDWGKHALGIRTYYLRVVSNNVRAVRLYTRAGFEVVERLPLKKVIQYNAVVWEELPADSRYPAKRFDLRMKLV